MRKIAIVLVTVLGLISCSENNNLVVDPDNLLVGHWSKAEYKNEELILTRVGRLPDKEYGVSFVENGKFVERTSGWCGTPPLSFFNIDGTWNISDETLIEVSTQSYLGNFNWRIQSLTNKKLVIKRELTEQEKDHRELIDLFTEIENLAYSVSCTDSSSWAYTAYGSKACGGPKGYIAYTTTIDTEAFLEKVAVYSEAEKQYNIKWNIVSTCDIAQEPVSVECQNNYPVLKY